MAPEIGFAGDADQAPGGIDQHQVADAVAREQGMAGGKVEIAAGGGQRRAHHRAYRLVLAVAAAGQPQQVALGDDADRPVVLDDDDRGHPLCREQFDDFAQRLIGRNGQDLTAGDITDTEF